MVGGRCAAGCRGAHYECDRLEPVQWQLAEAVSDDCCAAARPSDVVRVAELDVGLCPAAGATSDVTVTRVARHKPGRRDLRLGGTGVPVSPRWTDIGPSSSSV